MLVSTIICCYNYGRFVGEAIDSVLAQGVADHEVIVVDNASTDDTPQVLHRIRDPRLRIIRLNENVGFGGGHNVALSQARGEFLSFLDADDRWRPGKLKRELAIMASEPDVGLVFGDLVRFNERGYLPTTQFGLAPEFRKAPTVPTKCDTGRKLVGDCFETLVSYSPSVCWMQGMLVRRHLVGDVTFPTDRRRCPDLYYHLRIWPRVKAAYLDEPTAELRRHGANNTSNIAALDMDVCETLKEFEAVARLTPAQGEALNRRLGRSCLGMGRMHLQHRHAVPALRLIFAATHYPTARGKAIQYLAAFPLLCAKLWGKPDSQAG